MFNRSSRSRPNVSSLGSFRSPAKPSQSAPPSVANSSLQAQYKPDFPGSNSASSTPQSAPVQDRRSITSSYQQARAELANPALYGGPMTEKQTRELNWQKRQDPIGYRDQMLQNQRIYGTPSPQTPRSTPTRPTNFNNPRPRFGA